MTDRDAAPLQRFSDPAFLGEIAAAFADARRAGASAHDALFQAAHVKLPGMQDDTFAHVCLALAAEFDAVHGTTTVDDGTCLGRLINAYLLAIDDLRTEGSYDVNLPFFAVTPAGIPVHLQRTLTADVVTELARRTTTVTPEVATRAPNHGASTPAPTKKWYWPFGS